ncbi:MAG: hypothetical protein M1834_004644 [Cirrosporium novae-zelandiae]|nr:MAG: hypothetical protein M1834_004644 [Cirrosporium novae-zelandiae]
MATKRKSPKLPVRQLVILCICRFAEPVVLTSVYPYLPEMIESFNVPKNEVAKWAGLTSAVFNFAQCLTGVFWGKLSDVIGRKPAIMGGLSCNMVTSLVFGFSQSLTWAIVARAMAGAGNGNVGILRTTVAEMVPERELQPRAFSIMPLIWTVGSIFGPAFGGALASPVQKHPEIFGDNAFLRRFPFALPNMVASIFFFIGITTGILFLHETLETKRNRKDYGLIFGKYLVDLFKGRKHKPPKVGKPKDHERTPLLQSRASSVSTVDFENDNGKHMAVKKKPVTLREVFSRQSSINLLAYALLALHSVAWDQLLPIFMHHPVQQLHDNPDVHLPFKFASGFGINSDRIGLLFTGYGIFGMIFQFLFFPPLARRYGILRCFKFFAICFPFIYLATAFTALMPTSTGRQVTMFILMTCKSIAGIFAFPCSTILLTNSAASLRILGTLNGVATSISAIGRALGPAIGGTTFTIGVKHGYVILPWFTLSVLSAIAAIPVWWLVEMEGFNAPSEDNSEDNSEDEDIPEDDEEEETTKSKPIFRSTKVCKNDDSFTDEPDEFAVDDEPAPPLARVVSHSANPTYMPPRRLSSSPIGMAEGVGPGGGRRLSNNLGPTRSGLGTGGTSAFN